LPEDKKDMEYIQQYFNKNLQETIKTPDIEKLIKDDTIAPNTIEKVGNKIKIHRSDYREIDNRRS
jgi:hypothetical protein